MKKGLNMKCVGEQHLIGDVGALAQNTAKLGLL